MGGQIGANMKVRLRYHFLMSRCFIDIQASGVGIDVVQTENQNKLNNAIPVS